MKVLIDTNIILDVLCNRKNFVEDSAKVFKLCEDAIQSTQASRIKANYIITRNIKDYNKSKVTAIKPSELIERI